MLAAGAALAASGCEGTSAAQPPADVLEYEVTDMQRYDGEPYKLHRWRVPLERTRITVEDVRMRRALGAVARRRDAALVINGGFYGTDSRPEGLVVVGGRELNPLLPRIGGGVVTVGPGGAAQHDAEGFTLPAGTDFAIQCRPRLVVGGANNIARRGENTAARTALCVRDGGRRLDVYVARVDPSRGRAGPTLHKLAADLVAEGCEEALNLDGGPSTGAAWRAADGLRLMNPRRGVRHAVVFTLGARVEP